LVLAAKLKMALKEEKKQHRAMAVEERVLLLVEEIVTHLQPAPAPFKPLHPNSDKSHHAPKKLKQRQSESSTARPEVQADIPEDSGDSAM
jgi:hypothetical protein